MICGCILPKILVLILLMKREEILPIDKSFQHCIIEECARPRAHSSIMQILFDLSIGKTTYMNSIKRGIL